MPIGMATIQVNSSVAMEIRAVKPQPFPDQLLDLAVVLKGAAEIAADESSRPFEVLYVRRLVEPKAPHHGLDLLVRCAGPLHLPFLNPIVYVATRGEVDDEETYH